MRPPHHHQISRFNPLINQNMGNQIVQPASESSTATINGPDETTNSTATTNMNNNFTETETINQRRMALLDQVSNVHLYYGPYFVLANRSDLVPFAQLVDVETNPHSILDRLLQSILADGSSNGSDDGSRRCQEVTKLDTVEGRLNVGDLRILDDQLLIEISTAAPRTLVKVYLGANLGNEQIENLLQVHSVEIGGSGSTGSVMRELISVPGKLTAVRANGRLGQPAAVDREEIIAGRLEVVNLMDDEMFVCEFLLEWYKNRYELQNVTKKYRIGGSTYTLQDIYGYVDGGGVVSAGSVGGLGAETSPAAVQQENSPDCVVCLSEDKCVACLPCRHMCLCTSCAEVLRQQPQGKCPICRQHFFNLLQLHKNVAPTETVISISTSTV